MKRLLAIIITLVVTAPIASADSVNVLFGTDNAWRPFEQPVSSNTGTRTFWNNWSFDGRDHDCNIGFWLNGSGGCTANKNTFLDNSPGIEPPTLGNASTRFGITKEPETASVTVTTQLQVTAWATQDVFGWYLLSKPDDLQPLFGGTKPTIGTQTFVPSGDYGLYITNGDGVTYKSAQGGVTRTHFAVFRLAGDGHYMIGAEDMFAWADNDYNDLVFEFQSNPVPEPMSLILLGTGLLGITARARRRRG